MTPLDLQNEVQNRTSVWPEEEQERIAETVHAWQPDTRQREAWPPRASLRSLQIRLEQAPSNKLETDLRLHQRRLRTALRAVQDARESLRQVPWVLAKQEAVPRAYAVSNLFLASVPGGVMPDERMLAAFLDVAQRSQTLEMAELWALKPMLRLALLERIVATQQASAEPLLDLLRLSEQWDWQTLFEQASLVERTLQGDPAGAYARMDRDSRDQYRRVVSNLAQHSPVTEAQVATHAVQLAERQQMRSRALIRTHHVGYFLIDDGLPELETQVQFQPPFPQRLRRWVLDHPEYFYIGGVEVITYIILILLLEPLDELLNDWPALLLLPLPATQAAFGFMNTLVSFLLPPRSLPKLDFRTGIPDDCLTMVAVPTLLMDEEQVRQLVDDLEIRYLANRDSNLLFCLLTDTPDSSSAHDEKDDLVVGLVALIDGLNQRYPGKPFYLFHRHRMYNPTEQTWMGWERKRGKLLDLNKLLRNVYDSFPVKAGNLERLPQVRYVLTLDSDTQLPRDAAHRMVGTLAHPLNQAVIDPVRNIVVMGYGILQPRVGVSIQSASRSRLASLYSGQTGFDIYTRAVSDVYQDLFGEGIFTGKGLYDVDALHATLDQRFPNNALLSHDLIEGAYARAALVSDVEVIDDYPSHFRAYSRRKHRWVRGDWQILRWLFPRVPDFKGQTSPNPTSAISRWKIFDNLRRSLIEPSMLLLFLGGWFGLPGGPGYWTLAALALLFLPVHTQLVFSVIRALRAPTNRLSYLKNAFVNAVQEHITTLLMLAFLTHQSLAMLDAILRTAIRTTITRRKLLEWETAAQAEVSQRKRTPVDRYLDWTPVVSLAIGLLLFALRPASLPWAAPLLLLWAAARPLTAWLDRPPRTGHNALLPEDKAWLRLLSLHTWRYYAAFSTAQEHWLVPDNVQQASEQTANQPLVAHRLSPTNVGLLLNSRLAAVELGYLTLPEFIHQTEATLASMARLERHQGHLLNWYDSCTLQPMAPLFVSAVDNGNLAGCLWTLASACRDLAARPLLHESLWRGLRDHVELLPATAAPLQDKVRSLGQDSAAWLTALPHLPSLGTAATLATEDETWWLAAWEHRLRALHGLLSFLPAAQPDKASQASVDSLAAEGVAEATQLRDGLRRIAEAAERFVEEMDFSLVYDPRRKLLSVGYDVATQQRVSSCYDLLASESRMASFVAIAKGDIPQESWFHLGRSLVLAEGQAVLLSWTGTLFEYLMPSLWMRAYPDTLLTHSMRGVIAVQQRHVRRRGIPWGISEAAFDETDELGQYQYAAFGIDSVAIKVAAPHSTVISPYSTLLALPLGMPGALANLRSMEKRGWLGAYGFYESAVFRQDNQPVLVRSWMAHHQGMSLLALANVLADCPFPRWFHNHLAVAATELLLHEKAPKTVELEEPTTDPAAATV